MMSHKCLRQREAVKGTDEVLLIPDSGIGKVRDVYLFPQFYKVVLQLLFDGFYTLPRCIKLSIYSGKQDQSLKREA